VLDQKDGSFSARGTSQLVKRDFSNNERKDPKETSQNCHQSMLSNGFSKARNSKTGQHAIKNYIQKNINNVKGAGAKSSRLLSNFSVVGN